MATTQIKAQYPGNGTQRTFNVPFGFINPSHIKVYLNGTLTTAYTWPSSSSITFNTAPSNGVSIVIERQTPYDQPVANLGTGTQFDPLVFGLIAAQFLYVAQERVASFDGVMAVGSGGQWDAQGIRIGNMAAAVNPTDAPNFQQIQSSLTAAQAAATAASSSANTATTRASQALSSANTAQAAATDATTTVSTLTPQVTANTEDLTSLIRFKAFCVWNRALLAPEVLNYSQAGNVVTVNSVNHGFLEGHAISLNNVTGGTPNRTTTITGVTADSFTYTTTDSVTSRTGTLRLLKNTVLNSKNIHSVFTWDNRVGVSLVNFKTAFTNSNYSLNLTAGGINTAGDVSVLNLNPTWCEVFSYNPQGSAGFDFPYNSLQVIA